MSDIAVPTPSKPDLGTETSPVTILIFLSLLIGGLIFTAYSISSDVQEAGVQNTTWLPYVLLGISLLIALAFEFVNGFHDTANAVATVIYTHSLPSQFAVIWSGLFNFLGVLTSTGAVAFGVVSLLPVELILQVGSSAGFAMVFALLIAAILWNLGTWYLGLPASSSHTLIGSIIGVGVANSLLRGRSGTAGVDWDQAITVGKALLISPVVGFVFSALLLLVLKLLVHNPKLYDEPHGTTPPPWWIRGLLVATCTGVSFAHGSNDGQKGMGLIMLILIGTVPTAYALNRAIPENQTSEFLAKAQIAQNVMTKEAGGKAAPEDFRAEVTRYIQSREIETDTVPAIARLIAETGQEVSEYGSLRAVPARAVQNARNDMYLLSDAFRFMLKQGDPAFNAEARASIEAFQKQLNDATKFIPLWVKVAVAIALGLGTMIGWKRIVVTVGERIGKQHLTYAQGGAAELVAMGTIFAADSYGLPVSTTHVLSSGIAGTMAANRSGLQFATIRNILMAWVLTLPMAMILSGCLFWLFNSVF
jgi:PiT family inorganic phosphate transporter